MIWDDKVKMCNALNNGLYQEAIDIFMSHERDEQAQDMFFNGFDLTQLDLLIPYIEILKQLDCIGSFRADLRLQFAKQKLGIVDENQGIIEEVQTTD